MFHRRKLDSLINRLHERALRIVSLHLLNFLRKITREPNIQLLAVELLEVKNGLSSPFMNEMFVEAQHYKLRKNTECKRNNVESVYNGTASFTFLEPRIL